MDVGGPGGGSGSTLLTLDQLAIVGKNPVYYSADFDQTFYAGLAVRRIASDSLTLHDEIGQGAFGKVYKGTQARAILTLILSDINLPAFTLIDPDP